MSCRYEFTVTALVFIHYDLPVGKTKTGKTKYKKVVTDQYKSVTYDCEAYDENSAVYLFHKLYGYGSHIRSINVVRGKAVVNPNQIVLEELA
jgi:hypothetical protein